MPRVKSTLGSHVARTAICECMSMFAAMNASDVAHSVLPQPITILFPSAGQGAATACEREVSQCVIHAISPFCASVT